jgi:FKBP-type peptidyl-prolyl cis-trans isomerase
MHIERMRVRRAAAALAGSAVVLVGISWTGGVSWAAGRSPAATQHEGHKRHAPKMPSIRNATNLNAEPVVHPSKGRPPTKVEVRDLVKGTGATVTMASTVSVVYVGASYKTGKDFTRQTWAAKKATTFPLSGVVRGFAEGLVGMKVGGRREIVIPPKLGYGNHNYGPIKANETLVFVVDLKAVTG